MKKLYPLVFILMPYFSSAQVTITVNAGSQQTEISPWIYGRNNNLSDNPAKPVTAANLQRCIDAGLRMCRENGGNNCTKYNWESKLSSHPDWYNNVYSHDWDYSANTLLTKTTNAMGFYGFQLLGYVAANKNNNFDDYAYNQSQYWSGVTKNWAGGGGPPDIHGDSNLYLKPWTADNTTDILEHWFTDLQYDSTRLRYWNMDNEPEIWKGTHDDIAGVPTADEFLTKYIAVAKEARTKFPGIKLVGPVSPNEWQWYTWNDAKVTDVNDGLSYCWMEYFIKKIAEEQTSSGIRLLDVLDIHFYPSTANNVTNTLQLHRVWYDQSYVYPKPNGVKVTGAGNWDGSINKEYFFKRCEDWLTKYMGPNHGVKMGISEYGTIANHGSENANVVACWYASHLGTFANHGVELFTPWDWYSGQWEVLNLFSNHFGTKAISSTSSNETLVSGYSSLSADGDSLMIVVVNRDQNNAQTVNINLQNFSPSESTVNGYQLSGLSTTETFVSKSNNALQGKTFDISNNAISISAPKLSVTMIQIPTAQPIATAVKNPAVMNVNIYPNPGKNRIFINTEKSESFSVSLMDLLGNEINNYSFIKQGEINIETLPSGTYLVKIMQGEEMIMKKVVKE